MLAGKTGLICGVLNNNSIAWSIAKYWYKEGTKLILIGKNEKSKIRIMDYCKEWDVKSMKFYFRRIDMKFTIVM